MVITRSGTRTKSEESNDEEIQENLSNGTADEDKTNQGKRGKHMSKHCSLSNTKLPRIEEDKCKKIYKPICEGMKSIKEKDKTKKTGKTIRDKVPKIKKSSLSGDLMIHDEPFDTLQPNTNLNLNIQDTPSSQSPIVEIGSLYNAINTDSKSSPKQNAYSSKVSTKYSSVNGTSELLVYKKYKESTTHFSDEEMCDVLNSDGVSPLKQECNKKRKSNRNKKVSFEEQLIREKSPKVAVKINHGRPKKSLNITQILRKNNDVKDDLIFSQDFRKRKHRLKNLKSKKAALPDLKLNLTTGGHSIYSDFSSDNENLYGWQKGKEKVKLSKPKSKAIKRYSKITWSYRNGFLPNPQYMCRNMNVGRNTSDSGIYPLAPNNTPVSPGIAENEESKRKENYYYITDATDKVETHCYCPQQSRMIGDLASKSLQSSAQFSYVSEQFKDSFTVNKSGIKPRYGIEETSMKNIYASPQNKCSVSLKLHLSSDEDSPMPPQSLLQQQRTPTMVESDLENENIGNLNQTHEENDVNTAFVTSNDEHNTGTLDFSAQKSAKQYNMQNKDSELGSLQISDSSNKNINSISPKLFSLKNPIQSKNTHQKKEGIDRASQQTSTSHKNPLKYPEVSQHQSLLITDYIDISDLDLSSRLTPNQRSMIIQQLEEFKTHIAPSYHKTASLCENIMKVLGKKYC